VAKNITSKNGRLHCLNVNTSRLYMLTLTFDSCISMVHICYSYFVSIHFVNSLKFQNIKSYFNLVTNVEVWRCSMYFMRIWFCCLNWSTLPVFFLCKNHLKWWLETVTLTAGWTLCTGTSSVCFVAANPCDLLCDCSQAHLWAFRSGCKEIQQNRV